MSSFENFFFKFHIKGFLWKWEKRVQLSFEQCMHTTFAGACSHLICAPLLNSESSDKIPSVPPQGNHFFPNIQISFSLKINVFPVYFSPRSDSLQVFFLSASRIAESNIPELGALTLLLPAPFPLEPKGHHCLDAAIYPTCDHFCHSSLLVSNRQSVAPVQPSGPFSSGSVTNTIQKFPGMLHKAMLHSWKVTEWVLSPSETLPLIVGGNPNPLEAACSLSS